MNVPKPLVWIFAVGLFGAMLYTCALPGDLPADGTRSGFAGTYTVNGVDPLGVEYSGTVVISETDDTTRFDIEWIVTGAIQQGTGRLAGTEFTAGWEAIASGGGTGRGEAVYTVQSDGRLIGTKSIDGVEAVGTEEIFPAP